MGKYHATRQMLKVADGFTVKGDSTLDKTSIQNNHLYNCMEVHRFEEVINLSGQMLQDAKKHGFKGQRAYLSAQIHRLTAFYCLTRFEEGAEEAAKYEKEVLNAAKLLNNKIGARQYYYRKAILYFVNKQHRQSWLVVQQINRAELKKGGDNLMNDLADLYCLELIIQLEMKNYETLKDMALNAERKIKKIKPGSFTYKILLSYFKKVTPVNRKTLALKFLNELSDYYTTNNLFHRNAFGLLQYTFWLEEVSGGRTISQCVRELMCDEMV